ncbi:MAG: serine/threonine protein kinase [Acidimicrobiales bacterium]|nr:MAG: serine/threonine protein kinase [Acidimicrobiales bacterium]
MTGSLVSGLLGQVVGGRYLLIESLGESESGVVCAADDLTSGMKVAVKLLHPALAAERGFVRRLRTELRTVSRLRHPNLLPVLDFGEGDEGFWFVSTLMAASLGTFAARGLRLDGRQVVAIGAAAAAGLEHAHAHGVVHRGITPGNVLLSEHGSVCLGDFGVARALAATSGRETGVLGSTRYLAPEQLSGAPVGPPADVYSLALCLLEVLEGRHPFAGSEGLESVATRTARPLEASEDHGELGRLLEECGRLEPFRRPTAAEMCRALGELADRLGPPAPLPLVDLPPTRSGRTGSVGGVRLVTTPGGVPIARAPDAPEVGMSHDVRPLPSRGSRVAAVVVTMLLVVALLGGGAWAWWATRVEKHTVPDLIGLAETDARRRIDGLGWQVERVESRRDGTRPGEVIDQEPPPGESLAEGRTLRLVVSLGATLARPPRDLVGLTLEEARIRLVEAGFELGDSTLRHDEDAPPGVVIATERLPDLLPKGSAIDVVVSDGPRPREIPRDLVSQPAEEAERRLRELGLKVARRSSPSETVPAGKVVKTEPAAGAKVEKGSEVTLVVSSGPPMVEVPDVVGLQASAAAEELEAAGLGVEGTVGPPNRKVLRTDPPTGSEVRKGTSVTLYTE